MCYEIIRSPWDEKFAELIAQTREEFVISSPFLNGEGVDVLERSVQDRKSIKVFLLTNFSSQNILSGFTAPEALLRMFELFESIHISSVSGLHAKVYIRDSSFAVITSANLTSGGLSNNIEYGILLTEKEAVNNIKNDLMNYYRLGNVITKDLVEKAKEIAIRDRELRENRKRRNQELENLLKQNENTLKIEILKSRIKEGKTLNSIFSDTILYLLKTEGRLRTKSIHKHIKSIHPDICDDSIDRVINGQRFGKKWKHAVRGAQQSLQRQGLIGYDRNSRFWYLTPVSSRSRG